LRDPLLPPCAALLAGILLSRCVPFDSRELIAAGAGLFLLGLLALWLHHRRLAGACCLLALICGGALTAVANRPGPSPELNVQDSEFAILSGCVVEPPVLSGDREQFVLELAPDARARVSLYLQDGERAPVLHYGQQIEIDAKVRRSHNFQNPGAFDYARYLARRKIYWTASANSTQSMRALRGSCGSGFAKVIADLREAALSRIERMYAGSSYETGMMQAILIGETAKLQRVWTEHFRSTGTFHALVISGTHVAVLAGFLLFLLRICFVPASLALPLTVLASWAYALITGWQAPVIRSAAGLTLFMIGRHFYREARVLNLLAAVTTAFLLCDPEQLFEPSFQLSFLSVAFIAVLAVPLLERTSTPLARGLGGLDDVGRDLHLPPRVAQFRIEMRLIAETLRLLLAIPERLSLLFVSIPARVIFFVYELVVISAVVQTSLALPMIIYFHRIGFSGLSANAIVVPLMGLVVPAGFVAVLTGWNWPAWIARVLLDWSQAAVDWHARLEPNWRIPSPPVWLSLAFCAALAIAAFARRPQLKACGIASTLLLLFVLCWHPFQPLLERNRLELTAIDVGQGDSLLVAFPDGKLLVMDGGGIATFGKKSRTQLDIGEDVVSPYLWQRSIRRIDVLALSHAHEDHIGGLRALLDNFQVGELWTGAMPETPQWAAVRKKAAARGVRIVPMVRARSFVYGGTKIQVLSPAPDYVPREVAGNNDSLTLRLTYLRRSFLLSGDIEKQVESELAASNLLARTDVLKVAHHGSRTSSTQEVLDGLRPAFAIISCGYANSYGHPHPDTLRRLEQEHSEILRTDLDGLVSVKTDGYRISVTTARQEKVEPWLYSVF
jgi:competence protein ComEC